MDRRLRARPRPPGDPPLGRRRGHGPLLLGRRARSRRARGDGHRAEVRQGLGRRPQPGGARHAAPARPAATPGRGAGPEGLTAMATLQVEHVADHVTAIRLDRPDRLNAINFALVGELHDALDNVAADDGCKVVVLTGNGRGFCAGLDLKDFGTVPAPGGHRHYPAGQTGQNYLASLTLHLRATPQIVIAAVNGPAFGGGLSLSLACDLRIASTSAVFCSAFIRTGLTGTDAGVSYLLPRLIGASRAFDMIVTGRAVDAQEAERLGIVSRVVPDDRLWDEALSLASGVAAYTTFGLRNTKEVMWHNLDASTMEAAIALENRNQDLANAQPEVRQYMQAYEI